MNSLNRMRAVFMGTPAFAVCALDALADSGCDVVRVYTQPDRRSGRGRRLAATPVKQAAMERGIPVLQPASLRRDADAQRQLASLAPQIIVVAAYGLFLPPDALAVPPLGALNIHPSLLPRYRGPSPVASAILAGDAATGATIIKLDEGMDTGPIIAQRRTHIGEDETSEALTRRLFEMGAALLADVLPDWARGAITAQPQDDSGASVTRLLSREDGAVDWNGSAAHIARQVRAYHPWPGSFARWRGRQIKLLRARALPDGGPDAPTVANNAADVGLAVALDGGLGVVCGCGTLRVERLQMEGRQAVEAADFARGYADFIGSRLD